jgi:L-fucose isomerase-like protein
MKKYDFKIGVAPTRRNIFSKDEALRLKGQIYKRLAELKVPYVDIEDVNEEGLLFGDDSLEKVIEKFKREKVDGIFFPHVNFGTEDLVCKVAKALNVPVLLWGPRDGSPTTEGYRLTDSQCGLFATGKVLRRFRIPFNYMTNCSCDDVAFERGIKVFMGVVNVVKEFRNLKILQLSTRPADFWTMMCNEGELLERFGIQIIPVSMPEMTAAVRKLENSDTQELQDTIDYIRSNMTVHMTDDKLKTVAALKLAMRQMARDKKASAIAIQCWNALQGEIGIMPCAANGMLTDEGLPVTCETDIHGAITSVILQAAALGEEPTFFADWTIRDVKNDNAELLQHCGNFPISLSRSEKVIGTPFVFESQCPGAVAQELKRGYISIARFDGDNGEYSMLAGTAKVVDGPYNAVSYGWIEVENWPLLERKIVEGPYVHHCVGIYQNVMAVLYEVERYLGFTMDFYNKDMKDKILAWLMGE